jgi:hypothetical protein
VRRDAEKFAHDQGFGLIADVAESRILPIALDSDRVVLLIVDCHTSSDHVTTTIAKHMNILAARFGGTQFLRTHTSRTGGNQLLDVLSVNCLPALVCFREGVVASRAVHPHQLQQYVMMDEIGAAVFEAWMAQSGILIDSPQALVAAAALEGRRPRRQNSAIIVAEESTSREVIIDSDSPSTTYMSACGHSGCRKVNCIWESTASWVIPQSEDLICAALFRTFRTNT